MCVCLLCWEYAHTCVHKSHLKCSAYKLGTPTKYNVNPIKTRISAVDRRQWENSVSENDNIRWRCDIVNRYYLFLFQSTCDDSKTLLCHLQLPLLDYSFWTLQYHAFWIDVIRKCILPILFKSLFIKTKFNVSCFYKKPILQLYVFLFISCILIFIKSVK